MSAVEAQVTVDNSLLDFENLTLEEKEIAKQTCISSTVINPLLFFTKFYFLARNGYKFIPNWHHDYIIQALDRVHSGQSQNLIINVCPGSSKTELLVNFVARSIALNPMCKFLYLSAMDNVASENSQAIRNLVQSDEFQMFWPLKIWDDSKSKKNWKVNSRSRMAGGVYAASLGGQVTGFRAGRRGVPGFQGALIIDDPTKPDDSYSKKKMMAANRKLISVVKSRRATDSTPIILIMQRISSDDTTAFLEKLGGFGDWDKIEIPAIIDDAYVAQLPTEVQTKVVNQPQEAGRFSFWPSEYSLTRLLESEQGQGKDKDGNLLSRHVFAAQYMQKPQMLGGNLIHTNKFQRYKQLPKLKYRKIYVDTAQKTKEKNDYTVFAEWGICELGNIYLVDLFRAKLEAPDLITRGRDFWEKARGRDLNTLGQIRQMVVEDAASGTGLIQTFKRPPIIPVHPIIRTKDKLSRLMDVLQYIDAGQVFVPEQAPYLHDFLAECEAFSADMTHAHDDQVDTTIDAVTDLLGPQNTLEIWAKLGRDRRLGIGGK